MGASWRRIVVGLGMLGLVPGCFSETAYEGDDDDDETSAASSEDGTEDTASDATSDGSSTGGDESIGSSDGDADSTSVAGTDSSSGPDPATSDTSTSSSDEDSSTGDEVLDVEALQPGDLVITEVMWNPFCFQDLCEWVEVLNTTEERVSLVDLRVFDSEATELMQGRITAVLIVEPGARIVLARSTTQWPYEVQPDGVYGPNPSINNAEPDRISLRNGSGIIDQTPLMPFESPQGFAWALQPDFVDAEANDEPEHWCDSASSLPAGDFEEFGTPGSDEVSCVAVDPVR